jgi:general secretion pathway protein A
MQGILDATPDEGRREPRTASQNLPVGSRRQALESLRCSACTASSALVLLTGEPGSGKTWLWRALVHALPAHWRWLSVEMSPALDALEFLRLIADGLGQAEPDRLGRARMTIGRALEDESHDSRSWLLVIESAHHAPAAVWAEIQALVHEMEARRGFAALLLVGPTELARQLATRPMSAMANRLSSHLHLLPLDLDETRELVALRSGADGLDDVTLETIHRDAAGNPARLMRILDRRASAKPGPSVAVESVADPHLLEPPARTGDSPALDKPKLALSTDSAAALVPSKPPLRVEEGLIEVGWEGNIEAEGTAAVDTGELAAAAVPPLAETEPPTEELIDDHYAALQAWTEWARNRGRTLAEALSDSEGPADPEHEMQSVTEPTSARVSLQGVRLEPQHDHAPYSQLFTRLRQSS